MSMDLRTKKINLVKYITVSFFVTIIIYNSGYALSTVYGIEVMLLFLVPAFLVVIFRQILLKHNANLYNKNSIYLVLLVIGIILSTVDNYSIPNVLSSLRFLLVISTAYSISNTIEFRLFVNEYIKVIKYLTLISLTGFVLINLLRVNIRLPIFVNTNGVQYEGGLVFFMIKNIARDSIKNIGVFWESGLYSTFLLIALVFELIFTERRTKKFNVAIFILGIISTQSTAGIIMLNFIAVIVLGKKAKMNKNQMILSTMLLMITAVFFLFYGSISNYLMQFFPEIFSKLDPERSTALTRLLSPLINIQIWLENPIFGHGLTGAAEKYEYYIPSYNALVNSQTSTSTLFMSAFGLTGILITVAWVNSILKLKDINLIIKVSILVLFIFILNKEPHTNNLCLWCILFYFIKQSTQKSNEVEVREKHGCC